MMLFTSLFLGVAWPPPTTSSGLPPSKLLMASPPRPLANSPANPLPVLAPVSAAAEADTAFARLKSLVGEWRVADRPDGTLRIFFSLTAGDTVLIERWERAGRPHSLTLYHRSGEALVVMHYCPQGNQPRLALDAADGNHLHFGFRDATDLDTGESYLHDLGFDLSNPARPVRRETYRNGDTDEPSALVLEPV